MLQSMVDKLAAAVDENWVELTKLDLQFHLALVAAAASPDSTGCSARWSPSPSSASRASSRSTPAASEVVREHQEILDAIRARDLAEVDRLVAAHMDVSADATHQRRGARQDRYCRTERATRVARE